MEAATEVTLKIRMPAERYIALRHLANENGWSMNRQINHLVSQALVKVCAGMKSSVRGHDGDILEMDGEE